MVRAWHGPGTATGLEIQTVDAAPRRPRGFGSHTRPNPPSRTHAPPPAPWRHSADFEFVHPGTIASPEQTRALALVRTRGPAVARRVVDSLAAWADGDLGRPARARAVVFVAYNPSPWDVEEDMPMDVSVGRTAGPRPAGRDAWHPRARQCTPPNAPAPSPWATAAARRHLTHFPIPHTPHSTPPPPPPPARRGRHSRRRPRPPLTPAQRATSSPTLTAAARSTTRLPGWPLVRTSMPTRQSPSLTHGGGEAENRVCGRLWVGHIAGRPPPLGRIQQGSPLTPATTPPRPPPPAPPLRHSLPAGPPPRARLGPATPTAPSRRDGASHCLGAPQSC